MKTTASKVVQAVATTAFLVAAFALPASAKIGHRHHHAHYRSLTVAKPGDVAAAPDPFRGPGAIVTAPVAIASVVITLPFRAASSIFPATGNTPLILIGAPVHVASQVVQFPFNAVGSAFGAAPNTPF